MNLMERLKKLQPTLDKEAKALKEGALTLSFEKN